MKIFLLLFSFCIIMPSYAQKGFRIAELNTENFFDCYDDKDKEDDIFLPKGDKRWNLRRYWNKIQNIGKEIISMGNNQMVDIVSLIEVENDSVMDDLTRKSVLRRAHYKYVMTNSEDIRGIDVALLYQESTFKLIESQSLHVDFDSIPAIRTRDILYVMGHTYTGDTLHIFVCHFSSKLGGKKASEPYRIAEAKTLMQKVSELQSINRSANIIILGDFNETPHEEAITNIIKSGKADKPVNLYPDSLYNLSEYHNPSLGIDGTYKYKDQWEMIDQFIVSGHLLDSSQNFYTSTSAFRIHTPRFILLKDEEHGGYKPFKTYNGYKYQGGFSDHLPIYVDFTTR